MKEIIVIHGSPGSGKPTHSENLVRESIKGKPLLHLSAGNRIRAIRNRVIQSVFKPLVNDPSAPNPLDHSIVNGVIFEFISQQPSDSVFLIDGYPRFRGAVEELINKAG